jgi:hypothetical protein
MDSYPLLKSTLTVIVVFRIDSVSKSVSVKYPFYQLIISPHIDPPVSVETDPGVSLQTDPPYRRNLKYVFFG